MMARGLLLGSNNARAARDAAIAAQEGAKAATVAAKQFANAERPWMLISHNAPIGSNAVLSNEVNWGRLMFQSRS